MKTTYGIRFNGRASEIPADDAEHAARRAIMAELMEGRLPRGASYGVLVEGEEWIVDVAAAPGRGSVVARKA